MNGVYQLTRKNESDINLNICDVNFVSPNDIAHGQLSRPNPISVANWNNPICTISGIINR